jgi:predicted O-linked N-acetylglucosamine transferase (SPINDLY family)
MVIPNLSSLTFDTCLSDAFAEFRAGRHLSSLSLAEHAIRLKPSSFAALSLAAACAATLGVHDKAVSYWREGLRLDPSNISFLCAFGAYLASSGKTCEAKELYIRALSFSPKNPGILINMANLHLTMGHSDEAEKAYRSALSFSPNHVDALYNLALLLVETKRLTEAETLFLRSIEIQDNQPDVHNDLANLYTDTYRLQEAESSYRKALSLAPNFVDAHINLGLLLLKQWRLAEALSTLRQSVNLAPRNTNSLNALGTALAQGGYADEAEKIFRTALSTSGETPSLHNNLGSILMNAGRHDEAEIEFRRAVLLQPNYGHALGQAITCARQRYSWDSFESDNKAITSLLDSGIASVPALMFHSIPKADNSLLRKAGLSYSQQRLGALLDSPPLVPSSVRPYRDILRIGYLSADFRDHAVMDLAIGAISSHDRSRFHVHAYSIGTSTPDGCRRRVEAGCEAFRDLSRASNQAAARQIVDDNIDILIDLGGHTEGSRPEICALRPAPLIVNWLGFPGTLGHPRLADYIIGDAVLTPLEHQDFYSETIAHLPDCYQPNDPELCAEGHFGRCDVGLPQNAVVFCCFSHGYKLNPETFSVWCNLLGNVPNSVLWLLQPQDSTGVANLRCEAEARGIAASKLVFAPRIPLPQHIARLSLADIALDTFPYGSGATGSNMLRAGVPMITRMGESYVSRMAASQLHAIGLPELITTSWEQYLALGLDLALDSSRRIAMREKLAANRSSMPLFDTVRFTRNLESLYKRIWSDHCKGIRIPIT